MNRTDTDVGQQDDAALRHAVYSALLDSAILADWHREALRRRGLPDEAIDRATYRTDYGLSLPRLASFDLSTLLQVPGFYLDEGGNLRFTAYDGLLVPCRNVVGQIVALKTRLDHPHDGPKYLYCSSQKHGGSGTRSPVHVPLGIRGPIDRLRVTEGELKADAASFLDCTPTISIPGVGQWRAALEAIARLQAKTVVVAFDSDARAKRDVGQHQLNFAEHLHNDGIGLELETWDVTAKGIDDFLLVGGTPTVHVGAAALWMAREIAKQAGADPSQPAPEPRPKVSKRAASKPTSESTQAKTSIKLGPVLTEALGTPTGNRWTCRCGGKITIRTDRLGIERLHCWGCRTDEDVIGFLRWHYELTFGQACERLGIPRPARREPGPERVEPEPTEPEPSDPEPVEVKLRRCPNRSQGVMLRKRGQRDVNSVHPPCGIRPGCKPCTLAWEAQFRARFREGVTRIPEGKVYKSIINPAEWTSLQGRFARFAKKHKIELLYATVLHDTPTGEQRMLVVSNLPREDGQEPVKRETASGTWCDALRAAVTDQERPVNFSRTWPVSEAEPSDYERLGEIIAEPADVRAVAPLCGFPVFDQYWRGDRVVVVVQGFDPDERIARFEAFGVKHTIEEYRKQGLDAAGHVWFHAKHMAIPFIRRWVEHENERARWANVAPISTNIEVEKRDVQLTMFSEK